MPDEMEDFEENPDSDFEYDLEEMVDKKSVKEVLSALVNICYGKSEHLRSNWQDEPAAKSWERDAFTIDRILDRIRN